MPLRSVIDIDINDKAFDALLEKVKQYEQAVKTLPAVGGGRQVPAHRDAQKRVSEDLEKQVRFSEQLKKSWESIREHSSHVALHMREIASRVREMVSVGGSLSLMTGLATGFGFLGMAELGRSASGQRRAAMGLGTTEGGRAAFGLNLGRFVDPNAVLGGVSQAMSDPAKRAALGALGIQVRPGQDTADVAVQALTRARELAKGTSETNLATLLQSHRLGELGLGLEDLKRLKHSSDEEFRSQTAAYGRDKTGLGIDDATLRKWQDFTTQLGRAGKSIEHTFIEGLAPLAPALGNLSTAFTNLLQTVLAQVGKEGWIEKLSTGINDFAVEITKPEFKQGIEDFIQGVIRMAKTLAHWFAPDKPSLFDPLQGGPKVTVNPFGGPELPPSEHPSPANPETWKPKVQHGHWEWSGWIPHFVPDEPAGGDVHKSKWLTTTGTRGGFQDAAFRTPVGGGGDKSAFVKAHWDEAVEQSNRTGVDPRIILAQAGLESGWGAHAPGGNLFGIKGSGQTLATKEFVNGQWVMQQAGFRSYGSTADSFRDYGDFLLKNPRYTALREAKSVEDQIRELKRSGYATDPGYGDKIAGIVRSLHAPSQTRTTMTPPPPPTVHVRIHNETGGNAVASTAQVAAT